MFWGFNDVINVLNQHTTAFLIVAVGLSLLGEAIMAGLKKLLNR